MAYQYLWLSKSDKYNGYGYIATHIYYIIVAENNPSKYMNEIEQNIQVRNITDSPDKYIGNELVKVVNKIHVTSKKYVKEILQRYQQKKGVSRRNHYH